MATVPTRQRIDISNPIITRIQVEGNDVVSFLNGTDYIRGMSQIMPQTPTYISYRYDSITISQVAGDAFTFTVYTITEVGGNTFTPLTFQDSSDVVQAKTIEIYRLLVTSIFKGCCECGNTEPECSIQYTAGTDPTIPGTLYDAGVGIRINDFSANNQDFRGLWSIIQDGSWIFIFSKTDPTVYAVYQLSNYTDGGDFSQFDATLLAGPAGFPDGTELCVDVTSVGGSLVQGWQDTLDIDSVLDKDNTVDGAGFNFVFDNNESFTINSGGGSVETDATGASLNAGSQQILVTTGYIDIITPNHAAAGTGWVLAKTSTGHVEYVEAGTGTVTSVGLDMPSAFTVTNSPITSSGDILVTGAGDATQYINGLGELATLPVYTVENGLHTKESPADPLVFHLGGQLIEDTLIETTDGTDEYQLSVRGSADQGSQFPFGVANLGNGGVATFQDYGAGFRPNPSVEVVGDVDLFNPLLELRMEGNLPAGGVLADRTALLRLKYAGDPALARMSIDYQFKNDDLPANNVYFIGGRLTTEVTNFTANAEESNFELQLFSAGSRGVRMVMEGKGQLELTNYATNIFWNGDTNINNTLTYVLAVDNTGKVWKKSATGGGTVTSVTATGLLTTSPNPITTTGTVTSEMDSGFLVGRYSSGTGVFQQIAIGDGLTLSATGELTAEGGGGTYTVNNGLEPQTDPTSDPFNFQLGGPLVRNTTITSSGYTLNIDYSALPTSGFNINGNAPSSDSGQTLMTISNSGTTVGDSFETISLTVNNNHASDFGINYGIVVDVSGSPDGNYGIKSTASTNGGEFYGGQYGVFGSSTSSTGIAGYFQAKNGLSAVYAIITSATAQQALYAGAPGLVNNFVMNSDDALDSAKEHTVFERANSSETVPLNGFGERIQFKLAYESNGGGVNTNSITSRWLNADYAPGNGLTEFSFSGVSGFTDNTILSLIGTGQIQLNQYTTSTSFAAASGASVGVLNVDNAGNVFVGDGGGGGGGGIPFGTATASTPDVYTTTITGVTAPYVDGDAYLIRFTDANTGDSTLNINGIGAADLYSNSDGLLIGGDIWAGAQMLCVYNSSLPGFQCIGTAPNSLFAYVTNAETTAITKGMAVYAFGGTGDRLTVKKALATGDSTSAQTVGIVYSSSIAANQKGIIMIQGELVDLDLFPTSGGLEDWVDGDPVYLSAATAGAVTKDKQYAPNHLVYLGVCVKASNGSSGRMYVRIQNGFELDELHNVQAQTPANKDTLYYDNTVTPKQWKTASVPSLSGTFSIGITVDGSGGVITAGQKGYIRVPYACTINSWSILTGNAGTGATVTFDIWRANNAIPTVANTLVGGGTKPFLTSNTAQITSAAPSGWTATTLAANDILAFNVEAGAAVFSWVNLQLLVTKS